METCLMAANVVLFLSDEI